MTVDDLLENLSKGFASFDADAIEAWGAAYRKLLGHREGPHLAEAYVVTMASFVPKPRHQFPLPKDFEMNLPEVVRVHGPSPDSARTMMMQRREDHAAAMVLWWERQGQQIETARGWLVGQACRDIAIDVAAREVWSREPKAVILTVEQIELAQQRAASRLRVSMFNKQPANRAELDEQMAAVFEKLKEPRPVRPGLEGAKS